MDTAGASRTDNHHHCERCRLRFSARHAPCPRCGDRPFPDSHYVRRGHLPLAVRLLGTALPTIGFIVLMLLSYASPDADEDGMTWWLGAYFPCMVATIVLVNHAYTRRIRLLWQHPPSAPVALEGLVEPGDGAATDLVARRVVGQASHGDQVDDAWAVPFRVRSVDGTVRDIDPTRAWLAIPARGPLDALDHTIRGELRERGIHPEDRRRFRTGTLRVGDRVRIRLGDHPLRERPAGPYRLGARALAETDEAELVIEAVDPEGTERDATSPGDRPSAPPTPPPLRNPRAALHIASRLSSEELVARIARSVRAPGTASRSTLPDYEGTATEWRVRVQAIGGVRPGVRTQFDGYVEPRGDGSVLRGTIRIPKSLNWSSLSAARAGAFVSAAAIFVWATGWFNPVAVLFLGMPLVVGGLLPSWSQGKSRELQRLETYLRLIAERE